MGPDLRSRIGGFDDRRVYPGKLHIYDIETRKLFPLTTNEADGEVLLADLGFIYNRVLNQLFQSPLSDRGIGAPRLLATEDAILDAHWAFLRL